MSATGLRGRRRGDLCGDLWALRPRRIENGFCRTMPVAPSFSCSLSPRASLAGIRQTVGDDRP